MTILELALKYLEEDNFSIIPTNPAVKKEDGGKGPYIKEVIPYRTRKPTKEEVIAWWTRWPKAMISLPLGEFNNLMVIDADNQEAIDKMNDLLPESFSCPTVKTPRNDVSKHFYFKYCKDLSNSKGVLEVGVRDRLIVLPGSVRADGKKYELLDEGNLRDAPELPNTIYNYLLSCSKDSIYSSYKSAEVSKVSGSQQYWVEGINRDENLFTTANCLIKGGCPPDFAENILNLIVNSWGENDPKWVHSKIKSAMDRVVRRERNIAQELRDWINESVSGQFKVSDWSAESAEVSKKDRHAAVVALKKLCDEGIVERVGKRTGEYRIIEKNFIVQKWWEDTGRPLDILFPMDIHKFAKIYPGNIILLEGQKSQGKSAFALEFCRINRGLFQGKIRYQNVEMSDSELVERFRNYPVDIITINEWKESVEFIKRTFDWWDAIEPNGLNIVDYLVEYEKAYLLAQYVFNIHQKLKGGIALVIVQRDPFKPYPSGGRAVRDIPRLILSMMYHKIKIEDIKSFYSAPLGGNPTGFYRKYKQSNWWNFIPEEDWISEEENKYKDFKKEKRWNDE